LLLEHLSWSCQRFVKFFIAAKNAEFLALEWDLTGVSMSLISLDQTDLHYSIELCFAGAACDLRTNSSELARVLEDLSILTADTAPGGFDMRVRVDEASDEAAGEPHFRGLRHVVTACFGRSNVFVFDILRRTVSASVSGILARDDCFWKEKLIPITLGVLGAAMGLVPVHCACLEWEGDGLLIAGVSGAGKSTLSVALSKVSFNYVSDDWTYISRRQDGIVAHGTSAPVKLLPDAVGHFPGLQEHRLQRSMNGELAYEVDIAEAFGARVERGCVPRWLVFLERSQEAGSVFTPMSSAEARRYVNSSVERLPAQLFEAVAMRTQTIQQVALLPSWRFRYGGTPQFAAQELREFVLHRQQEIYV
jgi:hypothetical protein